MTLIIRNYHMPPLIWRYLLANYLKTFALCTFTFIAILLTMQMDEIAYFATLGPAGRDIFWFTLKQIPYLLPIALPIAALISAMLLMQSLSESNELTALRATGLSLKEIIAPILIGGLLFSLANMYIVSELSSEAHLSTGKLKNQLRSINPLILINNKHVMRSKGFYFDTLGQSKLGEYAHDVVFLSPSNHSDRLNLLVAKEVATSDELFSAKDVTLLTHKPGDDPSIPHEDLVIENIGDTTTSIQDFTQMLEKKIWSINNDHLRMPLLLLRIDELKKELKLTKQEGTPSEIKEATRNLHRGYIEIMRRFSVAFAVFSFTLLGVAFGINIGRHNSAGGIFAVAILASLYVISFFGAKSFDYALVAASLLYFLPHVLIVAASLWRIRRASCGIE